MRCYVIAAFNDDEECLGYFNGATEINDVDLEKATLLTDKGRARVAIGNLQRGNAALELRLVPVEMTVVLVSPATLAA